jgi:hypothetical protein
VLILKGDSNVVKEVVASLGKRLKRTANNIDIVKEEEGVEFVYRIDCLRTCPLATIVDYVELIKYL